MIIQNSKMPLGTKITRIETKAFKCAVTTAKEGILKPLSTVIIEGDTIHDRKNMRPCAKVIWSSAMRKGDIHQAHEYLANQINEIGENGRPLGYALEILFAILKEKGAIAEALNFTSNDPEIKLPTSPLVPQITELSSDELKKLGDDLREYGTALNEIGITYKGYGETFYNNLAKHTSEVPTQEWQKEFEAYGAALEEYRTHLEEYTQASFTYWHGCKERGYEIPAPVIPLPFDGLRKEYEKVLEEVSSRIKIAAQKEEAFGDIKKAQFVDAISNLLKMQKIVAGDRSFENSEGRPNRKAIGYIYGFIDGALQTIGQDMSDTSIGVPITYQVLNRLFPGRGEKYLEFLIDHIGKDEMVTIGIMTGGQQYIKYSKPGSKGGPMGFARFIIEGDR